MSRPFEFDEVLELKKLINKKENEWKKEKALL
jgi:hypothetical protein